MIARQLLCGLKLVSRRSVQRRARREFSSLSCWSVAGPPAINWRAAAMQSITAWLENLGLGQYGQCFAENGVDLSVLPDLTDQDLKDLGVLPGHRRNCCGR
jgi:SAM domain (Sterile alpha motif)